MKAMESSDFYWFIGIYGSDFTKNNQNFTPSEEYLKLVNMLELAGLLFCFFCFYIGCEMAFTNFFYTFGVCQLTMNREDATALISIFWVTFTIFRVFSAIQVQNLPFSLIKFHRHNFKARN